MLMVLLGINAPSPVVELNMLQTPVVEANYSPQLIYDSRNDSVESIEDKINRIAIENEISTTTLYNLVWSESKLDPLADNGKDRGIVQISRKYWTNITDEQAFNPDFALDFAAKKIKNEKEYLWVACNCYSYATVLIGELPPMDEIVGNTFYPNIGGLIIIYYTNSNGEITKHLMVIIKVTKEGVLIKEANYEKCYIGKRFLTWDYLKSNNAKYWRNPISQ